MEDKREGMQFAPFLLAKAFTNRYKVHEVQVMNEITKNCRFIEKIIS